MLASERHEYFIKNHEEIKKELKILQYGFNNLSVRKQYDCDDVMSGNIEDHSIPKNIDDGRDSPLSISIYNYSKRLKVVCSICYQIDAILEVIEDFSKIKEAIARYEGLIECIKKDFVSQEDRGELKCLQEEYLKKIDDELVVGKKVTSLKEIKENLKVLEYVFSNSQIKKQYDKDDIVRHDAEYNHMPENIDKDRSSLLSLMMFEHSKKIKTVFLVLDKTSIIMEIIDNPSKEQECRDIFEELYQYIEEHCPLKDEEMELLIDEYYKKLNEESGVIESLFAASPN